MKKIFFTLLFCSTFGLFHSSAQSKDDSLAMEMERLNRLGDSLHREQLKRDSINQEKLSEIARGINQTLQDENQKKLEEATAQVMKQHEKEQNAKRKTMLLALLAFLVTVTIAGLFFKRQREKNKSTV